MPRQTGARTQAALAYETTYGTAPASGYRLVPSPARRWGLSGRCWPTRSSASVAIPRPRCAMRSPPTGRW